MRIKVLFFAALIGVIPILGLAQQHRLAGRWATDSARTTAPEPSVPVRQGPNPFSGRDLAPLGRTDSVPVAKAQSIVLDLKIEGDKVSGVVTEEGVREPLPILEGMITGNRFVFVTKRADIRGEIRWNGEFSGENTILIRRRIQPAQAPGTRGNEQQPPAQASLPPGFGTGTTDPSSGGAVVLHRVRQ